MYGPKLKIYNMCGSTNKSWHQSCTLGGYRADGFAWSSRRGTYIHFFGPPSVYVVNQHLWASIIRISGKLAFYYCGRISYKNIYTNFPNNNVH
jgi:alkyl sulfatase BDS1-like metallo-beta-lactamase superfamily hydrolase